MSEAISTDDLLDSDVCDGTFPHVITAKKGRGALSNGRIFIDYLRNDETATAIAPYSTRARDGAPVAVPLDWAELPKLKAGNGFTIKTLPMRLKKLKHDPWRELTKTKQSLKL